MVGRSGQGQRGNRRVRAHDDFTFIDLFAGCGGFSLGLLMSGWKGLLAVEKDPHAFKTLRHNLVDNGEHNLGMPLMKWPKWFTKEPHEIRAFIRNNRRRLRGLRGSVQLITGGPPCQGFSFAGRRNGRDPRNNLFKHHLEVVKLVMPEMVLLENVRGIGIAFGVNGKSRESHAIRIENKLTGLGYSVKRNLLRAVDFGIPQVRPRYFILGIREDLITEKNSPDHFFSILRDRKKKFLKARGLPVRKHLTVAHAISDLETAGKDFVDCDDPDSGSGFKEIVYEGPKSHYQKLMHGKLNGHPINSLRLVNHRKETIQRFKKILKTCRKGVQLSFEDRERLGIRKLSVVPLARDLPSHTITTLPDDFLHYSEPRVHTVREHARIQSFPDWFEFQGKYTTGGDLRTRECPRYTQVGNAVPPLLAEAMGEVLIDLARWKKSGVRGKQPRRYHG